ncbi:hypothetical protein JAAARDRAFT_32059 [Jaapia argillacea MUCL 33604]|uniref:Helicase C-terminal domain-containing protein n=1 Tax=Jaapia argillacea MUCL 33604 TaxID=933084 RepID=A0A067QEM6_9AGAM|nr:hypothetical protein JAAARDRAFT_32059 [Jaapia argillacea MUCL 33604]
MGPFSLRNLLAAGTLQWNLSSREPICNHNHERDGWHPFSVQLLLQQTSSVEEDVFLRQLEFLIRHSFIFVTCRRGCLRKTLYARVYLIPYDLANVQGKLRTRDEATIVAPARRYMRVLLPRLLQHPHLWEGEECATTLEPQFLLPQNIDNRTMAEIYSDLPSPTIDAARLASSSESGWPLARSFLAAENIEGLRSQLYPYQRRSVATMLQKELCVSEILDPLYIPLRGLDGQVFHLQPATTELLRECPLVSTTRGGVLCEELGTGKTVMILSLVLATLDQLPSPEESILDPRTVLTPLSFRHFPFAAQSAARKSLQRRKGKARDAEERQIPSLVEILLNYIRVSPEKIGLRYQEEELEDRQLWDAIAANSPFYLHFNVDTAETRSRSQAANPGPRRVYLSSATLIIVPPNLLGQWDREILKHCDSTLRVLVMRPRMALPRVTDLASKYDIILMTHIAFSLESSKSGVQKLHSWAVCQCPGNQSSRVPNCQCDVRTDVSPLLQIRWKRLVVDEGHTAANTNTNFTPFAMLLSAERRWIVTGTPTTNLLGLSFGHVEDPQSQDPECTGESSRNTPEAQAAEAEQQEVELEGHRRRWTRYDREDLRKLSNMMTHFLGVRHFSAQPKIIDTHLINPLLDGEGPRPGAIQVLNQVMEMLMVRHRIEDVEKDVSLPPLTQETVLLDLDPYALLSYNALQASIAINAIDSRRVDQDYLFHPSNTALLLRTVENLSQSMFWHVDSDRMFNVDELVEDTEKTLHTAKERDVPLEDMDLLHQALHHSRLAAENQVWRFMQACSIDVPYRVYNMPLMIYQSWTRSPIPDAQSPDGLPLVVDYFLHSDRMVKMRQIVETQPLIKENQLVEWGCLVSAEDRRKHLLFLEFERSRKRSRHGNDASELAEEIFKVVGTAKRIESPEKLTEMRKELMIAQEKLRVAAEAEEEEAVADIPRALTEDHNSRFEPGRARMLASSPLAVVRVGPSASSKINYILNEIAQYSSAEKFLIFSKSPLSLAHVSEALEVIDVKYLQYTSKVPPKVREQLVMTFETSPTYRVFLMELKHGARGLNLVTASRVIFCEPVWQADVESQAIKRAHRIGQTRPIIVKTLAIRSTHEEVMIARRDMLKGKAARAQNVIDEAGMRHFIANPKFLPPPTTAVALDIPLINIPIFSPTPDREPESEEMIVEQPLTSLPPTTPPPRQIRKIGFEVDKMDNPPSSSSRATKVDGNVEDIPIPPSPNPKKRKLGGVRFVD